MFSSGYHPGVREHVSGAGEQGQRTRKETDHGFARHIRKDQPEAEGKVAAVRGGGDAMVVTLVGCVCARMD
jgi:hypothetical protein